MPEKEGFGRCIMLRMGLTMFLRCQCSSAAFGLLDIAPSAD